MPRALATPEPAPALADAALDVAGLGRALEAAFPARAPAPAAGPRVAVVIPCYNEAATIARVVADFAAALPGARILVFDNASTDATAEAARAAGAEVIREPRPGKGAVVRRMFAEIDADVYVMADGDGTYDAASAPKLVAMIADERMDMAIGARAGVSQEAHRRGHALGNRLFNRLYRSLFGAAYRDIFSGYRAFSRRFVKSFPALSNGFEIETELSVHAGELRLPVGEIDTPYGARVEGSPSKLRSVRDGLKILRAFARLAKETRPVMFFGAFAALFAAAAVILAAPLAQEWAATGLVPRLPTAVLCTGLALVACLLGACGLILDSVARARIEQKRMFYLLAGRD
ncbi:MAG TPA: glycosyltransferase [Beijerinckiaceae bacterium]|jgi:hypothetical protein